MTVRFGDDVELQYYRLQRIYGGSIAIDREEQQYVESPVYTGTGRVSEGRAPLSEIIEMLSERFGTEFSEEDRLFFQQIKEKACSDARVIDTARANPLDKFERGVRKLIEDLMVQRMSDNDVIVTRYMGDAQFQATAFPILARAIFETVRARAGAIETQPEGAV